MENSTVWFWLDPEPETEETNTQVVKMSETNSFICSTDDVDDFLCGRLPNTTGDLHLDRVRLDLVLNRMARLSNSKRRNEQPLDQLFRLYFR